METDKPIWWLWTTPAVINNESRPFLLQAARDDASAIHYSYETNRSECVPFQFAPPSSASPLTNPLRRTDRPQDTFKPVVPVVAIAELNGRNHLVCVIIPFEKALINDKIFSEDQAWSIAFMVLDEEFKPEEVSDIVIATYGATGPEREIIANCYAHVWHPDLWQPSQDWRTEAEKVYKSLLGTLSIDAPASRSDIFRFHALTIGRHGPQGISLDAATRVLRNLQIDYLTKPMIDSKGEPDNQATWILTEPQNREVAKRQILKLEQ